MLLRDEYCLRNNISLAKVKFIKKGFAFFGEQNLLLVIKWIQEGNHPGFYEISECSLEKRIITLEIKNIMWEEYENYIINWASSHSIITNREVIFNLIWEYFIRKNEDFFIKNYTIDEIFKTIDEKNSDRVLSCIQLLDDISLKNKNIYNFWVEKLTEVINLYCHWLAKMV